MCVKVKVEKRFENVKTEAFTLEEVKAIMQGKGKGGRELPGWAEKPLPNLAPA